MILGRSYALEHIEMTKFAYGGGTISITDSPLESVKVEAFLTWQYRTYTSISTMLLIKIKSYLKSAATN